MTKQSALERLVTEGESQTLEFKKSLAERHKGLQGLCAMVNADLARGRVIFGVDRYGNVCGIEPGNRDTAQRSLSQAIRSKFDPKLIVQIEIEELKGKQVLVLSAERSRGVSYHEYDGRAWIREGTENRQLTLTEKEQLMKKRNRDFHQGPWRCDQCGSLVGQLSSWVVSNEGMKKSYRCPCGGEFWPSA
jgi:ATP-dependent DNA helicase RecG